MTRRSRLGTVDQKKKVNVWKIVIASPKQQVGVQGAPTCSCPQGPYLVRLGYVCSGFQQCKMAKGPTLFEFNSSKIKRVYLKRLWPDHGVFYSNENRHIAGPYCRRLTQYCISHIEQMWNQDRIKLMKGDHSDIWETYLVVTVVTPDATSWDQTALLNNLVDIPREQHFNNFLISVSARYSETLLFKFNDELFHLPL